MRSRASTALLLVVLMVSAPLSGCFGEEDSDPVSTDLSVNHAVMLAG